MKTEVTIGKQDAVFWMDGQGRWHNQHGPFEHRGLIAHFNAAIAWDEAGYHVIQQNGALIEKVYFKYEVTALFAMDVFFSPSAMVLLNTGRQIGLNPEKLFVSNEQLYMEHGREIVKFSQTALMKMWNHLDFAQGEYRLILDGRFHSLPQRPEIERKPS